MSGPLYTLDLLCPRCDAAVACTVESFGDPVFLLLTDARGCPHADDLLHDFDFRAAAEEAAARAGKET